MMNKFSLGPGLSFTLKPLKKEDVEVARRLCDKCVGENLYTEEEIEGAVESRERFFCLLEDERGKEAGYVYYYLTTEEEVAHYAKIDISLLSSLSPAPRRKVGKIQSIGVLDEYRGIGIAPKLMEFVLNDLKGQGLEIVFIVCWKPKGSVPLEHALIENKFTFLTQATKVWYNDTRLICPYCKGRCLCDAEVYYKLLTGDET